MANSANRPTLSVLGVIYEALGFAFMRYGTALRVAWLPILLLLVLEVAAVKLGLARPMQSFVAALRLEPGYTFQLVQSLMAVAWPAAAVALIGTILQSSYAVPLIKYAATAVPPYHGSMQLSFGPRHVKYVVACAASFAGVIIAAKAAMGVGLGWLSASVVPVLNSRKSVFEPGSLHSVDTEPAFGLLNSLIAKVDGFFASIGINMGAIEIVVLIPLSIVTGYFLIRLMPLPFFAAAREPGAGYTSWGRTWRLTGGWNIFPMIAIVLLMILIHAVTLGLLWLSFVIFNYANLGSEAAIAGLDNFFPDGAQGPLLRGLLAVISTCIVVSATTFMATLNAGLGGALVHRGVGR